MLLNSSSARARLFSRFSRFCLFALLVTSANLSAVAQASGAKSTPDIRTYIHQSWDALTRSVMTCEALVDPKMPPGNSVLYFPSDLPIPPEARATAKRCKVIVDQLPTDVGKAPNADVSKLKRHGLLYLPNKYVVPGGRFNEMYGWDSFFIILGLLEDGRVDLAKGMVDNFIFELEHYGAILNANRTYYLTRSQPPFFPAMALAVYDAQIKRGIKVDPQWLKRVYDAAQKDRINWTTGDHRASETMLYRYFDTGSGPVPEEAYDGYKYYKDAAAGLLKLNNQSYFKRAEKNDLVVATVPSKDGKITDALAFTDDYYKGDRAMRESGFDISFRFAPYSAETHHYAPVCLNALLYKLDLDMSRIAELVGSKEDSDHWENVAEILKATYGFAFWDAKRGLFFDKNFITNTRSDYEYATTFYPLWTGMATKEQAAALRANLRIFEKPGGIVMSTHDTGVQWDSPFGWAPIQLFVIEGLRKYGYNEDADRISVEWLTLVRDEFQKDGTMLEKYDVVHRTGQVKVSAGYQSNVIGFGWTNGVFLRLLNALPKEQQSKLLDKGAAATAR